MGFFLSLWLVLVAGWIIHIAFDHDTARRTSGRVIELALLWVVVGGGVASLAGGLSHIGPGADKVAEQIGYAQSMFQWEVGWGDIALGVLGVACAARRMRDGWLTAAVVAVFISYGGDAIGHTMQLVAHDNHASANVSSLPSDIVQAVLGVVLLIAYRHSALGRRARPAGPGEAAST